MSRQDDKKFAALMEDMGVGEEDVEEWMIDLTNESLAHLDNERRRKVWNVLHGEYQKFTEREAYLMVISLADAFDLHVTVMHGSQIETAAATIMNANRGDALDTECIPEQVKGTMGAMLDRHSDLWSPLGEDISLEAIMQAAILGELRLVSPDQMKDLMFEAMNDLITTVTNSRMGRIVEGETSAMAEAVDEHLEATEDLSFLLTCDWLGVPRPTDDMADEHVKAIVTKVVQLMDDKTSDQVLDLIDYINRNMGGQ